MRIGLFKQLAFAANRELQGRRQGVDHRDAHTVEAARHLVGIIIKLTASVQYRHDDLCGRHTFFVLFGGNTAAIVSHCH